MAATPEPSDEADESQLRMALAEGYAYRASLEYMATKVADNGAMQEAGDYLVAIAQERAEGMYRPAGGGKLRWSEAGDTNCHLEVSVSDAADHRFIPALGITATLVARHGGTTIGPVEVPFLWHPGLYHYGVNLKLPGDGRYDVTIHIAAPTFMRHDKTNGQRYAEDVDVTFADFEVKIGKE